MANKFDDGRPCNTDIFLTILWDSDNHDVYDRSDAVKNWIEGDWENATEGLEIL